MESMGMRELYQQGEAKLGPGPDAVCGWPGCDRKPTWEVVYKAAASGNLKVQSGKYFCSKHAREFCLEAHVDLPARLAN